ncbi:MAG: PD-(D/E)XK nuclease family protein [Vicinamibacterales bacterium]|nr:PD-(D/E)XK nuclease family protein [Vicinamibacterales bacterium]
MITPRQTRLFRVANLQEFQRAIRVLADYDDIMRLRSCAVIVPTAAAADQLRRTLENHALQSSSVADRALLLPLILTRSGWYEEMHTRLPHPPRRLSDLEREVLLKASSREVARVSGDPPFRLRAGLLVEMLGLYDELRRRDVPVDSFERLLSGDLRRDADVDRGADRLLRQTVFLAAAFRGYESRLAATGRVDEHALRTLLLESEPARPLRHLIVTTGEQATDQAGLWPADFALLTRTPLLEKVDIVATQGTIAAGLFDRLQKFMPGFEEGDVPAGDASESLAGRAFSICRDREDELSGVAVKLKTSSVSVAAPLERSAVVFKRPLPYVYLARNVFADANIPYQTFDALPLAAEPYAATLDVVFEFVASEFTREPVVALLSSPHLEFQADGRTIGRGDIAALNRAMSDTGYLGSFDRLQAFAEAARGPAGRAAKAAAAAATELSELAAETARPSAQLVALRAFLSAHDNLPLLDDPLRERHLRARGAILSAVEALRLAHEQLDDESVSLPEVAGMLRRWIEGQTFAPRTGTHGVQVLDAQAARYGQFDEIFLVGLIDGEWPARARKSIFYPPALLSQLDWPDSRVALAGERAAFHDLLRLPRRQVHLSTFELENDSIVTPSAFLEESVAPGQSQTEGPSTPAGRIFIHEALSRHPVVPSAVVGDAAGWLHLRMRRSEASSAQFHGAASPFQPAAYTVSSLERYLECPFRYFADRVLKLEEDPEDEATLTPQKLGIFVHEVFQTFFEQWNRRGLGAITPENLQDARVVFREIVEPLLERLAPDEAAVQRTRLLGSAADEGLAEAVFQIEAEWETPVVERLLEQALSGEFEIRTENESRRVSLKGKADRIDLLADGSFRIIDYKHGHPPDRKLALQLPIYSVCAVQYLHSARGETWALGQAGYIAFAGDRRFVSMLGRDKDKEATLREAQTRLLTAIDAIERGEFPPRPSDIMFCTRCPHVAVCRKDYVGDV